MEPAEQWAPYAQKQTYEAGQYIIKEGEAADTVFLLLSGHVAVIKGADGPLPLVLNYRHDREMVGEVSLLAEGERAASVLAIERCEVLAMPEGEFWRMFDTDADFRQMVMRTVVDSLLVADESRLRAAESEHLLFEQLGALSDQNEQLARLMRLRQETMAFILHDLRNPLGLVSLVLSTIDEDDTFQPGEDTRSLLDMARNGVRRMTALVESMLEVERLESGESLLLLAATDPIQLINERVEQQRLLAEVNHVTLTVDHRDAKPPTLVIDRERIGRVITNLLDNALKFSPADSEIRITSETVGNRFTVAIEDSGKGIPPDQREHIFALFAQATAPTRTRGFGLGLTFCRIAVETHGGKIGVEEPKDLGGARFVFWLPVEDGTK